MLFLLFILLFTAYRLKIRIDGNREESEGALESLRISALSIYFAEGDFESEYFRTSMQNLFLETDRLLLLGIYSSAEGFHYLIARDSSYLDAPPGQSIGAAWPGEPRYTVRPVYENRITLPLGPGTEQDLFIDGIFLDLEKEQVFPILRELFYILIVYFLIASVFLLAAATVKSPAQRRISADADFEAGSSRFAEQQLQNRPASGSEEAGGLFSPTTGLGFGQHLSPRLTSELERSASSDQDLSLMLVKARGGRITDLARLVLEIFPLRDLAFEHEASAIAVIMPDRDLDQCLREAKDFHSRYSSRRYAENIWIGLSARNGRLVSSSRLLAEAEQALRQAESSKDGGIVAFRADPDRYRAAIAARGNR
jgi:hypothetical protein